jgi:hypothetical protein
MILDAENADFAEVFYKFPRFSVSSVSKDLFNENHKTLSGIKGSEISHYQISENSRTKLTV